MVSGGDFGDHFGPEELPKRLPRGSQEAPKTPQEVPKRSTNGPRGPQEYRKGFQKNTRGCKHGPRAYPSSPRPFQEVPKTANALWKNLPISKFVTFPCCLRPAARCRQEPVDVIPARRPQRRSHRFWLLSIVRRPPPTNLKMLFYFQAAQDNSAF